ncbi:hypothetical protein BH23CHL8_BH23CHL8_31520 [soil metagenome]
MTDDDARSARYRWLAATGGSDHREAEPPPTSREGETMTEDPIAEVRALRERLTELEARVGTDGAATLNAAIRAAAGNPGQSDRVRALERRIFGHREAAPPVPVRETTDMNRLIRERAGRLPTAPSEAPPAEGDPHASE